MNCDNETARQFTAMIIQQVTPFYIAALVGIIGMGTVAFALYRGKVVMPAPVRAVLSFALVGLVCFTFYRISYDRAFIAQLTGKTCPVASQPQ